MLYNMELKYLSRNSSLWFHYTAINLVGSSTHRCIHLLYTRVSDKTKAPGTFCLGVSHHLQNKKFKALKHTSTSPLSLSRIFFSLVTYHTICERAPFLKMFSLTIICSFKAQTTNKQFSQLLWFLWIVALRKQTKAF